MRAEVQTHYIYQYYYFMPKKQTSILDTTQGSHYIHQVTSMLATSKNILFPGHNDLLITGTYDLTL